MSLRGRKRARNDDHQPATPLGAVQQGWLAVARLACAGAIVGTVTLGTGSVQQGVFALSAAATAAQLSFRRS
jgi:hypothetical protein